MSNEPQEPDETDSIGAPMIHLAFGTFELAPEFQPLQDAPIAEFETCDTLSASASLLERRPTLISRLRQLASEGANTRRLVEEVARLACKTDALLVSTVIRCFHDAFGVSRQALHELKASAPLGGAQHNDQQIDEIILPLIKERQPFWF